jgi:hypothetical protein
MPARHPAPRRATVPFPEVQMSRARRAVYLFLALVMGAVVVPAPSQAAKLVDCATTYTGASCGFEVRVGDPDKPCIERDGKAYCPVFRTFYPRVSA